MNINRSGDIATFLSRWRNKHYLLDDAEIIRQARFEHPVEHIVAHAAFNDAAEAFYDQIPSD